MLPTSCDGENDVAFLIVPKNILRVTYIVNVYCLF